MAERISLPESTDPLAGVAVSIWKKFFFPVWDHVRDRSLVEDWRQELASIALEASRQGLRYGQKELPGFVYQRWYQFLRKYGFKRGKDGKWRCDIPILYAGEDFLRKVKEVFERETEEQTKQTLSESPSTKSFTYYIHQGSRYYFTTHFIERWRERIPFQFSPQVVFQQLALGEEVFRLILGNRAVKKRVKCPWFTIVFLEKANGTKVFLTILSENS